MTRRNAAFTLVELMIAMAIVMLVLYAAITFFIVSVRQYKVQTKIVETNIEGILGLELLRQDLESLGFGLPWDNVSTSTIETGTLVLKAIDAASLRAVVSLDNQTTATVNGSDYLVIRSARVGTGSAAGKWTTLQTGGITRIWGSAEEDLASTDLVIVLSPTLNHRTLVTPGTGIPFTSAALLGYAPSDNLTVTNIVYGVDNTNLKFPWNRADYYIDNTPLLVPQRCAPNTGVLVKQVVSHAAGVEYVTPLPLLDCVADLQIEYGLDTNGDGVADGWSSDISMTPAADIRAQLVEVHLNILVQQGQRDDNYSAPSDNITVGLQGAGRSFPLNVYVNGFGKFRWKVYTIVVKPRNLLN